MKKDENLCNRCGKCCYLKTVIAGIPLFTKVHCKYLDEETNLCTVYKDRFKKQKGCLSVEEAIQINALPRDCPYVKDIEEYQGPIWKD